MKKERVGVAVIVGVFEGEGRRGREGGTRTVGLTHFNGSFEIT